MPTRHRFDTLRRLGGALALAAALLSLAACERDKTAAAAPPSAAQQAQREAARHDAAVAVINGLTQDVERVRDDYFRRIDAERGPRGDEQVGRLFGIAGEVVRKQDLARLKSLLVEGPQAAPLDTSGMRLVRALEAALPQIEEMVAYYSNGREREDAFAKGRALHAPLVAAFKEVDAAFEPFHDEVMKIGEQRVQAELAQLKAQGKLLQHDVLLLQRGARELVRVINALPEKPDAAALDAVRAAEQAFSRDYEALKTRAADGERVAKEFGEGGAQRLSAYYSFCDGIQWSARDGLRAFTDKRRKGDVVQWSQQVTDSFNGLVQQYNRMLGLG